MPFASIYLALCDCLECMWGLVYLNCAASTKNNPKGDGNGRVTWRGNVAVPEMKWNMTRNNYYYTLVHYYLKFCMILHVFHVFWPRLFRHLLRMASGRLRITSFLYLLLRGSLNFCLWQPCLFWDRCHECKETTKTTTGSLLLFRFHALKLWTQLQPSAAMCHSQGFIGLAVGCCFLDWTMEHLDTWPLLLG